MLVRVVNGVVRPRDKLQLMATGAVHLCEQLGVFTPKSQPRPQLSAGEVGFVIAGIKELRTRRVGDTLTSLPQRPAQQGAARLQGNQAAGFRRAVSRRGQPVRGTARRAEQAEAQRLVAAVRARGLAGAGVWLSLRLSRPAAHGHRAGASGARVRHGPDHDRADRRLRGSAARRHACSRSRTRRRCPTRRRSRRSASPSSR